jgi:hypothetical protein
VIQFLEDFQKVAHTSGYSIEHGYQNDVEAVPAGMTRAVINNSDYADAAHMKLWISKHFSERNEHFRHNPRRVGKKIWEFDFFQDFDAVWSKNSNELKQRNLQLSTGSPRMDFSD